MNDKVIFIVGNDLLFSKSIKDKLETNPKNSIEVFNDFRDALDKVSYNTSAVILDTTGSDNKNFDIITDFKKSNPNTFIIVISESINDKSTENTLKVSSSSFVLKNKEAPNEIYKIMTKINETSNTDYSKFKNMIIDKYNFNKLIGESKEIQKVYTSIEKIIDTNINVSLHGEPGTGKEMIAKVIHYNSNRKHKPFISIDLRAIKYDARDKELLGVDRSIRDDKNNQIGFLERANGGTIFIEGFEDIDERFQFYLQKILQNKEIIRVGGIESIPLDVRIISSYNYSLSELISMDKVKELQYFRTMGAPINIPSLRERGNDIIILANKFIHNFISSNNMGNVVLNLDAKEKLLSHSFTGNVQELKAVIELATVMCYNNIITDEDIKFNTTKNISDFLQDEKSLKDYTRGIIKHFLNKYENNVLLVAEKLDVGKSTIYRMIKNNEI